MKAGGYLGGMASIVYFNNFARRTIKINNGYASLKEDAWIPDEATSSQKILT